ncbi:NTP transferase domain-containing protein [Patescibacteria group bacterium]
MKVIILAAGACKRLGLSYPKALLQLEDGTRLVDRVVDDVLEAQPKSLFLAVAGYKGDRLQNALPEFDFVNNEQYQVTGPAYSLRLALEHLDSQEDVLVISSDVCFQKGVLSSFIQNQKEHSSCLVAGHTEIEGNVKVELDHSKSILNIGHDIAGIAGTFPGIAYFRKDDVQALTKATKEIPDRSFWYEAINHVIQEQNRKVAADRISDEFCHDIDTPEDLKFANTEIQKR